MNEKNERVSKKDQIYREALDSIADFTFDEKVAAVFDDMLNRSIPGYQTIISQIAVLAQRYAQDNSLVYDLGCSHGRLTALLKQKIQAENCRIIAVDNSVPLLDRCRENLAKIPQGLPVEFLCEDICGLTYQDASVMVLNFILQFIDGTRKKELLASLCKGLRKQGVLILSEKITFPSQEENAWQIAGHFAHKKNQGYSDLEIAQKQKSLENVLQLNTVEELKQNLRETGFQDVYVWYQCFNFVSLLGVKR